MAGLRRPAIDLVVRQHLDDVLALYRTRQVVVTAGHVELHRLRRLDDRLLAHLDGLAIAGNTGWSLCEAGLAELDGALVFAYAVRALEEGDASRLAKVISIAEAALELRDGLRHALAWVSASVLQGVVRGLLGSKNPFVQLLGLWACEAHGADPGATLTKALDDPDAALRAQGLRSAGALGRLDLRQPCVDALGDADDECRLQAAGAALLLGDRGLALNILNALALAGVPQRRAALGLFGVAAPVREAASMLRQLVGQPPRLRELVRGVGIAGDPQAVAWLIEQMDDPRLARLAGESFTMITGVHLAECDFDRRVSTVEAGTQPSDDPADEEVAMDEDDGLSWPDRDKLADWWVANGPAFQVGTRYFMGMPPSREHCLQMLTSACQRQREMAARHLCLLQPGTKLFSIAAPAWRQQRWLDTMRA